MEDAVGMELCHDVTAMYDRFKGAAFKRGHGVPSQPGNMTLVADLGDAAILGVPDVPVLPLAQLHVW